MSSTAYIPVPSCQHFEPDSPTGTTFSNIYVPQFPESSPPPLVPLAPQPLTVTLARMLTSPDVSTFSTRFQLVPNSLTGVHYDVTTNYTTNPFTVILEPGPFAAESMTAIVGATGSTIGETVQMLFTFVNVPDNFPPQTINIGDRYHITAFSPFCDTVPDPAASLVFYRLNYINTSSSDDPVNSVATRDISVVSRDIGVASRTIGFNSLRDCNCACTTTGPTGTDRVPIINISGQTTDSGEYLSDMTFSIMDKYQYCDNEPIRYKNPKNCRPIFLKTKKLKETIYFQYGPPLQYVVKGKGNTLRAKLFDYYLDHQIEFGPDFAHFSLLMYRYGMIKYVLARILYGKFDIKYLCRNFNKQFFKDLKKSRFCGFIEFFEDPNQGVIGFEKNFIKCCI